MPIPQTENSDRLGSSNVGRLPYTFDQVCFAKTSRQNRSGARGDGRAEEAAEAILQQHLKAAWSGTLQ